MTGQITPADVGLYSGFQIYTDAQAPVLVQVPVAKFWLGVGREYLGEAVVLEGFFLPRALLANATQGVAAGWLERPLRDLQTPVAGSALRPPWASSQTPVNISGFFVAYAIQPQTPQGPRTLHEFHAEGAGRPEEAVAVIRSAEVFVVGATLKEICTGCASAPFDVGVYDALEFVGWQGGASDSFNLYQVPLVFLKRGVIEPLAPGQRVTVHGLWVKQSLARDAVIDVLNTTLPEGAREVLGSALTRPEAWLGRVHNLEGFFWVEQITLAPLQATDAPVVLMPPSVSGSTAALQWYWLNAPANVTYKVFKGGTPAPQGFVGSTPDTRFVVQGLSSGSWWFRIQATTGQSGFARSSNPMPATV